MKNVNGTEEFNQLAQEGSVYIQFSANWCGPCRMLAKTIEDIEETETDITFLKVDVDSNRDIAQQYGVRSIPRVILMKDGEQVGEFIGAKNKNELQELLQKTLK
jgi:thioredoxin 1